MEGGHRRSMFFEGSMKQTVGKTQVSSAFSFVATSWPLIGATGSCSGHCRISHLAKMHFVKHDLIRVSDTPKSSYERQYRNDYQGGFVVPF